MSITPYSSQNQTGLVPQTLLGYSSNGVSAIEITSTEITIAGDLNTATPIYVGISASTGLTTTLSTGLDVNCDLNMNSNDITNLNTLKFDNTGIDISDQATDAQITSNNGGQLFLTCSNDLKLDVNNASIVELTPTTLTLTGEIVNVNTNVTTGLINLTTGDLFNGGGIKWNTYPMGITFFNKWNGTFTYNTPTAWEIITPTNPFTFPSQFLHSNWAVQVSLNCWNVGSAPADKELAFYIDFLDGNSITYTGFNYRNQTPFANYFNTSAYTNTSQNPLSITYTDYFDFTGAVNNLELRLNWYGNQSYQQEFNLSTTFTLMTLIS